MKSHWILLLFISSIVLFVSSNPIGVQEVNITCKLELKEFNGTINIQTCVPNQFNISSASVVAINNDPKVTNCKAFYVKNSQAAHLPVSLSQFLPSLEFFIFEDSKLIEINLEALKGLKDLLEISFHKNLLTDVIAGTFSDNKKLRKISLNANRIKNIDPDIFNGLTHLREVYLDDNEIETLDASIFRTNPEIRELNFEINHIKMLPVSIFHGLKNLHTLKLDYNELTALPDRIFIENEELKIFSASNNKIELIGENNIEIFRNCLEVNLLDNECTGELYREYEFEELEEVIKNNCKVTCEDQNKWLNQEITENKRAKRNTENFEELEQKVLENLKKSNVFVTKTELESLQRENNREIEKQNKTILQKNDELNELQKNYTTLEERFNKLKVDVEKIPNDFVKKVDYDSKNSEMSSEKVVLENSIKDIKENMKSFEKIEDAKKFIENLEKKLNKNAIDNKAQFDQLKVDLESKLESLKEKVDELKNSTKTSNNETKSDQNEKTNEDEKSEISTKNSNNETKSDQNEKTNEDEKSEISTKNSNNETKSDQNEKTNEDEKPEVQGTNKKSDYDENETNTDNDEIKNDSLT